MKTDEREALRHVVDSLERNTDAAPDPARTLAAWRALVEGRWSLLESFDAHGHRYLIVRRNSLEHTAPSALSRLEAQALLLRAHSTSYKVIAAELSLSTAAAHNLVQSGMKKLGIQDETELPALFGRALASHEVRER